MSGVKISEGNKDTFKGVVSQWIEDHSNDTSLEGENVEQTILNMFASLEKAVKEGMQEDKPKAKVPSATSSEPDEDEKPPKEEKIKKPKQKPVEKKPDPVKEEPKPEPDPVRQKSPPK